MLAALDALDRRLTAAIQALTLPLALESLVAPSACLHGYTGTILIMPTLWMLSCWCLGLIESHGLPGYYLYMYTALCGQFMSRPLKMTLLRPRPGCRVGDFRPDKPSQLPHRHYLPGSPCYIMAYPEAQLRAGILVRINGWQDGVGSAKAGHHGGDAGSFPSGDSMGGAAFAALLGWYTPLGVPGAVAYSALVGFARVFYWFHWIGDVIAGALLSGSASFFVVWAFGGKSELDKAYPRHQLDPVVGLFDPVFFGIATPCFFAFTIATGKLAKWIRARAETKTSR